MLGEKSIKFGALLSMALFLVVFASFAFSISLLVTSLVANKIIAFALIFTNISLAFWCFLYPSKAFASQTFLHLYKLKSFIYFGYIVLGSLVAIYTSPYFLLIIPIGDLIITVFWKQTKRACLSMIMDTFFRDMLEKMKENDPEFAKKMEKIKTSLESGELEVESAVEKKIDGNKSVQIILTKKDEEKD